jgi:hypothetical protein
LNFSYEKTQFLVFEFNNTEAVLNGEEQAITVVNCGYPGDGAAVETYPCIHYGINVCRVDRQAPVPTVEIGEENLGRIYLFELFFDLL